MNVLVAVMLLLSYILPYLSPKNFAILSVLNLAVPFLIIVNILFFIYWLLKVKKQLLLSLFVLLLGYNHLLSLYKFSGSKNIDDPNNLVVMNYNVRLFNLFNWIKDKQLKSKMTAFIAAQNPDIISVQEYRPDKEMPFKGYFKHVKVSGKKLKNGQAIFSKFPIVNAGSVEFPNTHNNAIFVDIVKQNDTIRIYNVHLQSLGIIPEMQQLANQDSESLYKHVSKTFRMQQAQTELFLKHKAACPYKMVICGDFNNTAYSYVYKQMKGNLQDAFVEGGNGFGRTFNFKFFPVRIDFILADEAFTVNGFKTYDIELSDHYPIMAKLKLH